MTHFEEVVTINLEFSETVFVTQFSLSTSEMILLKNEIITLRDEARYWAEQAASVNSIVGWGSKNSSTDPGTLFQMSIDDDYLYMCVAAGSAGHARWKRTVLFQT
jgi:hypothetical protein